jgi:hypothetical protein
MPITESGNPYQQLRQKKEFGIAPSFLIGSDKLK